MIEAIAHAGKRLVAGGAGGAILLSDDNGGSWRQAAVPVSVTITAIRFTDERAGWAVGHFGAVLRTLDGGAHWGLIYDGMRAAHATLAAAQAANLADNPKHAQIEAARRLLGGNLGRPFLVIQTEGSDTVRLIGADGLAVETLDAGTSWSPWSGGIENPKGLSPYALVDHGGLLLVAGQKGLLLMGRPEDGLRALPSPFNGNLFGALGGGHDDYVLFGQQGHAYDGSLDGRDWHEVETPSDTTLTAGVRLRDGSVLLGDASGAVWRLKGKPDDASLEPTGVQAPFPVFAMTEAPDGSLILGGQGGLLRIPPAPQPQQPKP